MVPARLQTLTLIEAAIDELSHGRPVLLYDSEGREQETDMVFAGEHTTPQAIQTLRTQAGGLVCATLDATFHQRLGLPFQSDLLEAAGARQPLLRRLAQADVPYEHQPGSKPSFTLSINHRKTFTGITDNDRSLTIRALSDLVQDASNQATAQLEDAFATQFKSPGHVFLLNAHPKLVAARRGHTELATALCRLAGVAPVATICEMMNGPSGRALPKRDAIKYAGENGLVFLEGREVIEAWQTNPPPAPA